MRPSLLAAGVISMGTSLTLSAALAAPARYEIDPAHFSIVFHVDHIGYQSPWGMFLKGEGGFVFDEAARTLSDLAVTIDAASIFTNHAARDEHLRSDDFLMAETHPEISFVMTDATPTGETTGTITGDLRIRGETRPVSLDVTLNKIGEYPFGDTYVVGITAETTLQRSDWGMTYGVDNGWVGDEVPIIIELEAIRQD